MSMCTMRVSTVGFRRRPPRNARGGHVPGVLGPPRCCSRRAASFSGVGKTWRYARDVTRCTQARRSREIQEAGAGSQTAQAKRSSSRACGRVPTAWGGGRDGPVWDLSGGVAVCAAVLWARSGAWAGSAPAGAAPGFTIESYAGPTVFSPEYNRVRRCCLTNLLRRRISTC